MPTLSCEQPASDPGPAGSAPGPADTATSDPGARGLWVHLYEVVRWRQDRYVTTTRWSRVTDLGADAFAAAYTSDEATWLPAGDHAAVHVLASEQVPGGPRGDWARQALTRDGGTLGPARTAVLAAQHADALARGPLHHSQPSATTPVPETGARAGLGPTPATPAGSAGLERLIYTSRATRNLHSGDLVELLDVARTNNEAAGLTGMLLFSQGLFLQQLEGPSAAVDTILAVLLADTRHTDLTVLAREPVGQRDFPGWAMGFTDPDPVTLSRYLPGYVPVTADPSPGAFPPGDGTASRAVLLSLSG